MSHQGAAACHWCKGLWPKDKAFRRHCFGGHHRWLSPGDPLRAGREEEPFPYRTPASVLRAAEESRESDISWGEQRHPRKVSGVNGISALSLLPLFNIVWDVMPDWMHIVKNLILAHFIKLVKGKRKLLRPEPFPVPQGADVTRADIDEAKR
jgi:hypothetical protein